MLLAISSGISSFLQLITVLIIFIFVLFITWVATKWMANIQNGRNVGTNIEVIETYRLTANKYVQIIRIGEKYLAVAICKDTVTLLAEIPEEQIQRGNRTTDSVPDFKKLLEKARNLDKNRKSEE